MCSDHHIATSISLTLALSRKDLLSDLDLERNFVSRSAHILSVSMSDTSPIELPSLANVLQQVRAWTPTIYRASLYFFATLRQVPFIGTLASLLAGYMILLFVWRTVTNTIRTAFKLAKWAALASAAFALWSSVSSAGGGQGSGGLLEALQDGQQSDWANKLFSSGGQQRSSMGNNPGYASNNANKKKRSARRNTSSQKQQQEYDDAALPEALMAAVKQAGTAAQWLTSSGDGMGWLKEQWEAVDNQAREMDKDVDRSEKPKQKSWF